jgi:hypothetical protein
MNLKQKAGHLGGLSRSPAKTRAARKNGKLGAKFGKLGAKFGLLGGRPRTKPLVPKRPRGRPSKHARDVRIVPVHARSLTRDNPRGLLF